ncbi:2-amino-4-hydroxy-6-hydroxymethyldihydropteridine diphosphokinase [Planctomicrobium sp. SH668]|uniref:2-amino-4-hydroxy-6- hydroxymethyldihydropteridine diphosphokinase n=1 Tax=Planctomicrobium sp. SH668 TaxID=3448126 RepID=UPI003F5C010A
MGSNIRPEHYLPRAVELLAAFGEILAKSLVWQSAPVGDLNQADFCNAAVLLKTASSPQELRFHLRQIEAQLARVRDPLNKNAARTIDLDLSIYDHLSIDDEGLRIPDPEITQRPFVAVPLCELMPDFCHPDFGKTLREIADAAGGTKNLMQRIDISL